MGDAAYLILVCSGPGVFAGDALQQSIHVKSGARVVLVTQSSLQVHPSHTDAAARVEHAYRVDDDGELHCQWDPVIPFAGARLEQRFEIDVASGGRIAWSDALMSGRAGRGEAWRFERLSHELRVRIGGSLAYLERYALTPDARGVDRTWIAGDRHYFATAIVRHSDAALAHAEALHRVLDASPAVNAGVDLVGEQLLIARLASASGAAFAAARREIRRFTLGAIFNRPDLADRK